MSGLRGRQWLGVELAGEVFQAAVDLDGDHAVAGAEPAGDAGGGREVGTGRGPGEYALGASGLARGLERLGFGDGHDLVIVGGVELGWAVTDSNVYGHPGSSWQLTATPSKRGSRVEMVWQRTFRRNPRGLFFGTLFRIAGRPIFGHYARQVIANLETLERSPSPHLMARRPSGTKSAGQGG